MVKTKGDDCYLKKKDKPNIVSHRRGHTVLESTWWLLGGQEYQLEQKKRAEFRHLS